MINVDYAKYDRSSNTQAIIYWGQSLLPESWLKISEQPSEQRSEQSILGRILLFKRLCQLGYSYHNLPKMHLTTAGKPYFDTNIYFSLAYDDDIVVLATSSTHPVGIDVQTIRPISWKCYEHYFEAEEWLRISRSSHPMLQMMNARVTKEAASKIGTSISPQTELKRVKVRNKQIQINGKRFFHYSLQLPAQYLCKVATQKKCKNISVKNITPQLHSQSALYVVRA